MKFEISKTSLDYIDKPCENAKPINNDFHNGYYIEINSLEELLEFINKHGQIVMNKNISMNNNLEYDIEIYDTWRE